MGENGNDLSHSKHFTIFKNPEILFFYCFSWYCIWNVKKKKIDSLAEYLAVAVEAAESAGEVRDIEEK